MKAKRKPTKTTKGERMSAKAELDMLKNPQSGDPEFEAYQEKREKKNRPVLDALKKTKLVWNALADYPGPTDPNDPRRWAEALNKVEVIKKDDPALLKIGKAIARATPVPVVTTAITTGGIPLLTWPSVEGTADVARAIGGNIRKKKEAKQDIKAVARANKPNATTSEKNRGELVRAKYEKRGLEQEERDKQRYYGKQSPYTLTNFGFGGKFKKK